MTREEAIEWMQEEKASFERAPDDLNGCPMTEYWQKAIDVYDMAISALRKQDVTDKDVGKWISVKDRLPEMGEHYQSEDVLVCIDYRPDDPDTTEDTYVSIDHVDFNCFEQGEFSCERDDPRGGEPSPYYVTHWMPLPEPPEEGTV